MEITNDTTYNYKASAYKAEMSNKYYGLTLFDELIIESIREGNSVCKTAKALGVNYRTVRKRIATNFDLRQQLSDDIEMNEDYIAEQLLDELHRIALSAKSDGLRIKAIAEYLKVLGKTKALVEINSTHSHSHNVTTSEHVESILRQLGI